MINPIVSNKLNLLSCPSQKNGDGGIHSLLSLKELKKQVDLICKEVFKDRVSYKDHPATFNKKGELEIGCEALASAKIYFKTLGVFKKILDQVSEKYPAQINQRLWFWPLHPLTVYNQPMKVSELIKIGLPLGKFLPAMTTILVNSKTGEIISDISNGV